MKKLHFILIILIVLIAPDVFAENLSSVSYSQADSFAHSNKYDYSTDNYLGDQTNFSIGTIGSTYSGKSYYFQFNFHKNLVEGATYDLKISSTTSDFTNNINIDRVVPLCASNFSYYFNQLECSSISVISVIRGSTSSGQSKNFTIRFAMSGDMKSYWGFKIAGGLYNLTGVNNFKVTGIELKDVDTSNTQSIIDNQKQNTQDIIDNQSNNTQNIIDNQNQNTQSINDNINNNLNNCTKNFIPNNFSTHTDIGLTLTKNSDGSISVSGTATQSGFINFFTISNASTYFDNDVFASLNSVCSPKGYCITLPVNGGFSLSNGIIWSYVDSGYSFNYTYYPMLTKSPLPSQFISPQQELCTSKIDDTTNAVNDVNDSINNSNVESGTGQGFFDNFTSQDFGLSQIITIPLTTIQGLTSKSCVPLQVPIPFTNSNLTLPCMTEIYDNKLPTIYNLWKIVSFGIVAYLIAIDIFHIVKGFKDPESDKVEVLDL